MRYDAEESSERHRLTFEVLELGEALFDTLIEAATNRQADSSEDEPYPIEDMEAAAAEFFAALRLLLGLEPRS